MFVNIALIAMFSNGTKTRIASIFAPLMNKPVKENFVNGALYRTLPLDDNSFELPFSIYLLLHLLGLAFSQHLHHLPCFQLIILKVIFLH